nr:chaperone protein DnaJ 49 [Ipomoea batatas]
MDCNKDEAMRSKEIAEKKFLAKDVIGAKKFAHKAHTLYPGLEGIAQMLATLDVYVSAENRVNGEVNFYEILGVNPQADEDAIRKQYRKLALILHPDKNKSIGAEGAFKHLSEAWSLLSDKDKKSAYDQKHANVFQKKVQSSNGDPSQPMQNGFYNFAKSTASRKKPPKGNATSTNPTSSKKQERRTFWTVCYRCKVQYEYLRKYLHHNLLCPNCHEAFFAVEITPPSNGSRLSTDSVNYQQQENLKHHGISKKVPDSGRSNSGTSNAKSSGFQWSPFSKTAGPASAVQAANVVQQAYEKVKRQRQEAQAATKREDALRRKNSSSKRAHGLSLTGNSSSAKRKREVDNLNTGRETLKQSMESGLAYKTSFSGQVRLKGRSILGDMKGMPHHDVQHMLMEKAKLQIQKKWNEWSSATLAKSLAPSEANVNEETQDITMEDKSTEVHGREDSEQATNSSEVPGEKYNSGASSSYLSRELSDHVSIDVLDSDFYNFNRDRTESCFGGNQIWAAYDNNDGMPRYYAMVHNVVSINPFTVRISWLSSLTNSGLGPQHWFDSGSSKTCGGFKKGRQEIYSFLNCFSHKVKWSKDSHGAIQIFPRKGDVWALYTNWSREWNELTDDDAIHKYDLMEILDDYDEEHGVIVAPLVKVAGFKAVFHRHLSPREIRIIPRDEIYRFSHQVPSHLLTGKEGPNAPKGCRELDPAAMPSELLHVIPDANEVECIIDKGNEENISGHIGKTTTKEKVECSITLEVTDEITGESMDTRNKAGEVTLVKTVNQECL